MKIKWNEGKGLEYESFPLGKYRCFKRITLDGKPVNYVCAIDTEAGELWCFAVDKNGPVLTFQDGGELLPSITKLTGRVEAVQFSKEDFPRE